MFFENKKHDMCTANKHKTTLNRGDYYKGRVQIDIIATLFKEFLV